MEPDTRLPSLSPYLALKSRPGILVWILAALPLPFCSRCLLQTDWQTRTSPIRQPPDFEEFNQRFGWGRVPGSPEYQERRHLFLQSAALVEMQNSDPHRLWTAALNEFSDRTEAELAQLRGYRHLGNLVSPTGAQVPFELVQLQNRTLPARVSWAHLKAMKEVLSQGHCGACWAHSASTVLRAHHEIHRGSDRTFSRQELISCVLNWQMCGGLGGCIGATHGLAVDYVWKHGIATEEEWPYTANDTKCKKPTSALLATAENNGRAAEDPVHAGASLGMGGWDDDEKAKAFAKTNGIKTSGCAGLKMWCFMVADHLNPCPVTCGVCKPR